MMPAEKSLHCVASTSRIAIHRAGDPLPLLVQRAMPDARPSIHPIRSPDGDGTLTEDAPPHHPWQHGLYTGLNGVNGFGFWTEGLRGSPSDGSFHPRPLGPPDLRGNSCSWRVETIWRAPDGGDLLMETQAWTFHDRATSYELDLRWTLQALVDLTFERSSYGGLFVRMPFVDRGTVLSSSGASTIAACEGQRAAWVAIAMPIPDRRSADPWAGLAIMDHPSNPEHPSPWRVDGQFGIAPSRCIAGPWQLNSGVAVTARHRVYIHPGATDPAAVAASWHRFMV